MNESNLYLNQVISNHLPHDLRPYIFSIGALKRDLLTWADGRCLGILESGSRAKGTAISPGSDVDFMVSLPNDFKKGLLGLEDIYESLYDYLLQKYSDVRKQNVSIRIKLQISLLDTGIDIDITPARKQLGNTDFHSLHVSKDKTWQQTNVQRHITYVAASGRLDEIKLLKIWREQNKLNLPSIYLEFLLIDQILRNKTKSTTNLADNFWPSLKELSLSINNPLFADLIDISN